MGKTLVSGGDFLELILQAVDWANLADDTVTSPAANITVALHTADPGTGGTQATNEAAYTSYARVSVVRSAAGWDVTSNVGSPVADIEFPTATGGSETETHWSIGTGTSDYMIASGTISPNIPVSTAVQPKLTTASTITET